MRSLYFILLISCLWACTTDEKEPYDTPFIHIMTDKGVSKVIVKSDVNNINTYSVYSYWVVYSGFKSLLPIKV